MRKSGFIFLMASIFLAACNIQPPDPIEWGQPADESKFEFDAEVDHPESGDQAESGQAENDYDPDAPPPPIELPSVWYEFRNAPIQNAPGNRSADAYLAVLLQFGVEKEPCRYEAGCGGTSDTRCNIYASDVMNAMGAHLPTKGELGVGHGDAKTTDPMPANAEHTHNWLEQEKDGWRKLDPNNPNDWALLQEHLAAGKPALTSHPDHIAVLRPDQPGDLAVGDTDGLRIAQAGADNSSDTVVEAAFGDRTVGVYIHE